MPRRVLPRNRVRHIKSSELDASTAQTEGMQRFAALSGATVGSEKLWMGETLAAPGSVSANHHHGDSETMIYIRSGHPEFVFFDGASEVRVRTEPGDYIFVPPHLPHREENPDPRHTGGTGDRPKQPGSDRRQSAGFFTHCRSEGAIRRRQRRAGRLARHPSQVTRASPGPLPVSQKVALVGLIGRRISTVIFSQRLTGGPSRRRT